MQTQQSNPSPEAKIHADMALAIARQVDAEIRRALNHVMGTKDWRFEDLMPRCGKIEIDGVETFIFDRVALVGFGPPSFERMTEGGKTYMRVVRNIERFWEALEEVEPESHH